MLRRRKHERRGGRQPKAEAHALMPGACLATGLGRCVDCVDFFFSAAILRVLAVLFLDLRCRSGSLNLGSFCRRRMSTKIREG